MPPLSVFDLLALHDFVADMPANWLHRLVPAARPVHLCAGLRLCREDAPADRFWLVHTGAVAIDFHVPGRGDVVIERLGPGTVVGWSWLLEPYRWRFGAVIAEDIRAVEIDAVRMRAILGEDPDFGRELQSRFLAVMGDRLQAARHRLVELYAYSSGSAESR